MRFTETVEQSKALDRTRGFRIVIAASGMCEAGRIRHRLKNWIWRDEATALFSGYQAAGTLGRILLDGARSVRIQGDEFAVRARIRSIDLYSGHADGPELAGWVRKRLPIRRDVFLTHGEEPAITGLSARLAGIVDAEHVEAPVLDESFELTPDGARRLSGRATPRLPPREGRPPGLAQRRQPADPPRQRRAGRRPRRKGATGSDPPPAACARGLVRRHNAGLTLWAALPPSDPGAEPTGCAGSGWRAGGRRVDWPHRSHGVRSMSETPAYHYGVIARAIDNIAGAAPEQLSLEQIAAGVGLSPAHFQRVFSQWAGVSPKRYQQYLALDHAKRLLAERHSVLDAALGSGLSGGGRLHDLFLRWEAMSPGEYARGGGGLTVFWGWFDSPFGPALVMGTDKGICGIGFAETAGMEATMEDLLSRWPEADFVEDPMRLRPWALAAFGSDGALTSAPVHLIGAPFQIKVWEALLRIPSGHVATYSDIAAAIGHPKAARAVGTAIGRNPISWVIPCHRALRKAGGLGGYHWGLGVKRAMLAWESARLEAAE